MDDWIKTVITIIIAVAFISVIVGITQPTVSTESVILTNVALVKGVAYKLPNDNLVDGTFSVRNTTEVFVTPSNYNLTISTGVLFPGNMSTLGTYNISYTYYPDSYDTGASGVTTRNVAQLLPAGFVLLVLIMIFVAAIGLYKRNE